MLSPPHPPVLFSKAKTGSPTCGELGAALGQPQPQARGGTGTQGGQGQPHAPPWPRLGAEADPAVRLWGGGGSPGCPQPLGGRLAEAAPGVEAAGEGPGLVAFPHQPQLAGPRRVLGAHVLDVDLGQSTAPAVPAVPGGGGPWPPWGRIRPGWGWGWTPSPRGDGGVPESCLQTAPGPYLAGFEAQLDLHLAGLGAHPHVDLRKGAQPGSGSGVPPVAGCPPGCGVSPWGEGGPRLTSCPLSSSMMSSSARSSWQKSEHFSDTAK